MKTLGYLLLCAGFLFGAFSTALDTQLTNWQIFTPALLVALAGVFIIKRQSRGLARSEEVLTANRGVLRESLESIVAQLHELIAAHAETHKNLPAEIDQNFRHELRRFADARESMIHLYGLQAYADIMNDFAAGERYLNRVWSAAADGYAEEAATYLGKANAQFEDALKLLMEKRANSPA